MKVSFEGIGELTATFEAAEAAPGDLVKLSGNGQVSTCADGDAPVGVVKNVWGGVASVQLRGYVRVPCDEGFSTLGIKAVSVKSGKLADAEEGGRTVLVTDIANGVAGVIL